MLKSATLTVALVASANAFWRMECPVSVGTGLIDPIVNPGGKSAHAHDFFGSSGVSASADSDDLINGKCTSCKVKEDKSSYWLPACYFEDAKGQLHHVKQRGGILAYYFLNGNDIKPFPKDFRMLSGTTDRRSYTLGDVTKMDKDKSPGAWKGEMTQGDLAQRALGFNCLNYGKAPEGTLDRHFLPEKSYLDANCPNGLRVEIMFPSCWDGKSTDSKDHKSHVAFPDSVMNGRCPSSHPVQLPGLMYEVIFQVDDFKGQKGRFVFSNGDPTGYGVHADFMFGWKGNTLEKAIKQCTNPSGKIQDCPVFTIDEGQANSCKADKPLENGEDFIGPMAKLPNNVKITTTDGKPGDSGSGAGASASYKAGEKPSDPAHPLPGNVFKQQQQKAAESSEAKPTEPPASSDPSPCSNAQLVTTGNLVKKICWETVVATITPGAKQRRHAEHHAHKHGKH